MEVKPVNYVEKPKYPLKTELKEEELKKQIPKRWMQCPAAKIAFGTLAVVALAGCAPERYDGPVETVTPQAEASASATPAAYSVIRPITSGKYSYLENYIVDGAPMGKYAISRINVAPLFLHGEGRGTFGSDTATPPAFISEDEALTIVNEVASGYGLSFSAEEAPEYSVLQPVTNIYKPDEKKKADTYAPLKTDFADREHGIVIEFVSVEDVKQWHQDTGYASEVETYDTRDAAEQLSDSLENFIPLDQSFGTIGVFYDPCEYSDNSKPGSGEQLKAQAKDFFEWLKAQGVI